MCVCERERVCVCVYVCVCLAKVPVGGPDHVVDHLPSQAEQTVFFNRLHLYHKRRAPAQIKDPTKAIRPRLKDHHARVMEGVNHFMTVFKHGLHFETALRGN